MNSDYLVAREYEVNRINEREEAKMFRGYKRDKWYVSLLTEMENTSPLSDEELNQINDFWKPYDFAYKNDPIVQWGYSRQLGRFDPCIMGLGCLTYGLPLFHSHPTWTLIKNKYYLQRIFSDDLIRHPRTIIANDYGIYINSDGKIVSESDAVDIVYKELRTESELIIKPSGDSAGCGVGVTVLKNGQTIHEISEIFKILKTNFICTERIKQHESFARPNESSLNTLRVATFMWDGKVNLSGCMYRMGMPGSIIDSWSQGGVICSVNEDGVCSDDGLYETGKRTDKHPNGFVFGGHKLFNADLAQKIAVHLHESVPHLNYVSWDMSVDSDGKIVLIEVNQVGTNDFFNAFGINIFKNREITKSILDKYLCRYSACMDWNYREYRDRVILTAYEGQDEVIHIPESINGKRVQLCWDDAFLYRPVKELYVPETVEFVGDRFNNAHPQAIVIRS